MEPQPEPPSTSHEVKPASSDITFTVPTISLFLSALVVLLLFSGVSYVAWRESQVAGRYSDLGYVLVDDELAMPPAQWQWFSVQDLLAAFGGDEKKARLFALLDRDGNGHISLSEYETLVHAMRPNPGDVLKEESEKTVEELLEQVQDPQLLGQDPALQYRITFVVNDLRIHFENDTDIEASQLTPLSSSLPLYAPSLALLPFGVRNYTLPTATLAQAFLPPSPALPPGTVFPLVVDSVPLPQNLLLTERLLPGPYFYPREKALHEIIRHFHPTRAFFQSRNFRLKPLAMVVAVNEEHYRIAFRLFVEFQLSQTNRPIWFSPDSLAGNIILRKDGLEIRHFDMHQDNNLADVNQFRDEVQAQSLRGQLTLAAHGQFNTLHEGDIHWDQDMTLKNATNQLALMLFPIRGLRFVPWEQFRQELQHNQQLLPTSRKVHIVVTQTNLMDHSCHFYCEEVRDAMLIHEGLRNMLKNEWINVWLSAQDALQALKELQPESGNENTTPSALFTLLNTIENELRESSVVILALHWDPRTTPENWNIRSLSNVDKRLLAMHTEVHKEYSKIPAWWDFWTRYLRPDEGFHYFMTVGEMYMKFLTEQLIG